jgi:hypothetical protein
MDAYERFEEVYADLKKDSVDKITKKAVEISDAVENVDALPIAETAKVAKVMYIEPVKDVEEDVNFILDTRNLAKRIAPSIQISKEEKKKGKILVSPDIIQKVRRQLVKESEHEKERRSEYPQLAVDVERGTVQLNGDLLDLHPTKDEIKCDAELFVQYMKVKLSPNPKHANAPYELYQEYVELYNKGKYNREYGIWLIEYKGM